MSENEPIHTRSDDVAANASVVYLLITLGIFGWLLFDIWIDAHHLAIFLGYDPVRLHDPEYHLIAYTIIGGAIGGIVNGIRSVLLYYHSFNRHYIWKYVAAPWMGAALALIGFALLHSTVAIFGGDAGNAVANTPQNLANFAIGTLAGYGSKDVFVWLDDQVTKLFKVEKETPEVTGESLAAAAETLHSQNLSVGATDTTPANTTEEVGKIVAQNPVSGTMVASGDSVNVVVATDTNGEKPASGKKSPKTRTAG